MTRASCWIICGAWRAGRRCRRRWASTTRARRWSPGMARAASPPQRHRLAGCPHPADSIETAEGRGRGGADHRARRPSPRSLFLRQQAAMDHRSCARGEAAAGARQAAARHQRQLLPRPPGGRLCHRRHHGLAHQPDESRDRPMGSRALPPVRRSHGDPGGDPCRPPAISAASAGCRSRASLVDQQAALFGHGCRKPGQAKITFGTGAFALCRRRIATWRRARPPA